MKNSPPPEGRAPASPHLIPTASPHLIPTASPHLIPTASPHLIPAASPHPSHAHRSPGSPRLPSKPRPPASPNLAGHVLRLLFLLTFAPPAARAFDIPQPGRVFTFPRDHGSHPAFRLEWWYVTGHLWDASSNRFGFQSTFFRTSGPAPDSTSGPTPVPLPDASLPPSFGSRQLFLAHTALLDVATGCFLHQERLNREGWDAGSETPTLHVWNGNGSLHLEDSLHPSPASPIHPTPSLRLRLRGSVHANAHWDLLLTPAKPLVVFGTNGVSRKGAPASAASHYLTFSRLHAEGTLTLDGQPRPVRGLAWMDHEFSSSQLAPDQTGWDWVAVQLLDGRELMAYRLRRQDGSTDPFSTLAWIDRDGRVTHQPAHAFQLQAAARWRSPRTGAEYPRGIRLITTDPADGRPVQLELQPLAADQELSGVIGGVPYWEGACRVLDDTGAEVGSSFVELTGYAGDLSSRLR